MYLGRGKAYRRTLVNDAPTEAQYLATKRAELPTGRFEANVRMTRANEELGGEDASISGLGERSGTARLGYKGRMQKPPQVFQHLGPHAQLPAVAECCRLTERVWLRYLELARDYGHTDKHNREFLIVRMLYIAEITSSAIRLNASWGLTHAAMSLLRDRYEQTLRFSWLVRNPDPLAFSKYDRTKFAKMGDLARSSSPETRVHFEKLLGPIPAWATELLSKDERAFFEEWSKLDLRSMGKKRDEFPPLAEEPIAKEKLGHWYDGIYAQFSSVSHYDRYSLDLITINRTPTGKHYLGAQPYWPRMLILQNAHFDIIQCFEAAHVCHKQDAAPIFNALLAEWIAVAKQIAPATEDIIRET
jgi:hypothetical protein